MSVTFHDLGLTENLLKAIDALGFTQPTPIQAEALPHALAGRDVMASANTGTGKTAAFVLPALQRIAQNQRAEGSWGPRVLVLTPTRELATQVMDNVKALSKFSRVHTGTILGGMPYRLQLEMLRRRVDLIVATPGRLLDHMGRDRIDLSGIELLVLDEADRMLDMGFRDAVEEISSKCPPTRQTLLFTATLDGNAERLAKRLLNDPVRIDVAGQVVTSVNIDQRWLKADGLDHKHKLLDALLADESFEKGIVFAATKRDADRLAGELFDKGHASAALHGDMQQRDRNRVVTALRQGRVRLVVATDVAARGIDVADLTHVINFDLPRNAEDYVHRIGRTGRAGNSGISYSLFTRQEMGLVKAIERYTNERAVFSTLPGLEPSPEPARRPGGFAGKPGGFGKPFGHKTGGYKGHGGGHGAPREGGRDGGWGKPRFRDERPGEGRPAGEARPDREPREHREFRGEGRPARAPRANGPQGAAPLRRAPRSGM
ncbi:DEAD/DEAH box helicase [Indioceanicola profundi]|uniref:DEAD/DEAH box helicase n=1 Tax=Indioceanicola profundi TaxID=2220096 RepID=UPI000E6AB4AB|nr:DEAD/DEAH box helicase [Indioceanicola profundi]